MLINSTVTNVGITEDVTDAAILGVLDRWIAAEVDWDALPPFSTIGIDEVALSTDHGDFLAVLTAHTATGDVHVLAMLPDRLTTSVLAWLNAIPEARRAQIVTVCTDMWEGYISAASEAVPHARIVIDRFHVARH
jgi:transposase